MSNLLTAFKELANNGGSISSSVKFPMLNSAGEVIGSATIAELRAQIITDQAYNGTGYGTCSTAATTAAKVASISNFTLKENGIVSILFSKAINVANPTLNVNSTGAKAIYIQGVPLQSGVVKAGMVAMMQYDGTRYNITSLLGLEQSSTADDLFVDMGLPSGLKWAKYNIDVDQENGFATTEEGYGSHFSWGNTKGYNAVNGSYANVHDWGSVVTDAAYADTDGADITGNIPPSMDMARANLGAPWRLPTKAEFQELYDNSTWAWTTRNGVSGYLVTSNINGNTLFFPAAGHGDGTSLNYRGSDGYYWSSSFDSAEKARNLSFNSVSVNPQSSNLRCRGFSVRAVQ